MGTDTLDRMRSEDDVTKTIDNDLMPAWREANAKLRAKQSQLSLLGEKSDSTLDEIATVDAWLNEQGYAWWQLFSCAYTDQGGRLRLRKQAKPRKSMDGHDALWNLGASLHAQLRWHRGNGQLDSIMYANWRIPSELRDGMETVAVVLNVITYGNSPASENWQHALYGLSCAPSGR
jgi:hypothetical protein